MRFPYLEVSPTEFAPIIPLKLLGKEGWIDFEAYIDSGASFSIFHADRAEILGIPTDKGKEVLLTVGDGGLLKVYIHKIHVELANESLIAEIGFSKQLGVGFNLLGRKSFFDQFRICFNDGEKFVEIIPIGDGPKRY